MDMDTKKIEEALGGLSTQIKEQGKEILEKAGAMTAEQKERIDGMLLKQGELQEALREVQQKQARADEGQHGHAVKSIADQAVESEEFKSLKGSRPRKGQSVEMQVKLITTAEASVGAGIVENRLPGLLQIPDRRLTIRDLLAPGRTDSPIIRYTQELGYTNNTAVVPEGTRKPESDITLRSVVEEVTKLATFIKVSSEALADVPFIRSLIDNRLRYMLKVREEDQLLMGSGIDGNLRGVYTQATAYAAPTGVDAATTPIDKIRIALLQAELAEFPSDGLVLNPTNWANMEMQKDSEGRYLIGNPQGAIRPTLWNRPIVTTKAMPVGNFLAGAFQLGAQIFDREDAVVVIATENEDDFVRNLVTILIEERLGLAVYRPEAFVKGTLAVA
jgi:HK97 family phage major capsid protein